MLGGVIQQMADLPPNVPWGPGSAQENAWLSDVLNQHGYRALGLALRIVGHFRDAEDVLQSSLLKLLQRARKRPIHNLPAYLNAVIKTTALDLLAKRKAERLTQTLVDEYQIQEQTDPSEPIQAQELAARLERAIGKLDPRFAKVIIARDLNGQSYDQIACEMGISQHTARSYHWLAMREMQKILPLDRYKYNLFGNSRI